MIQPTQKNLPMKILQCLTQDFLNSDHVVVLYDDRDKIKYFFNGIQSVAGI